MLGPVSHLLDSVRSMARYPWNGAIPFEGHMYAAQALPRRHTLEWLVIGSPLHTTVLAVVGLLLALAPLAARRPVDSRRILVLLYLVTPLILLAALHSTLYNGPRQFMFLVPALVLVAGTALVRFATQLTGTGVARRLVAGAAVVLALGGQVEAVVSMARPHPYEYVYFSPLVGGFRGAVGRYELDNWGVCNKRAAEWLAQQHSDPRGTLNPPVTVDGNGVYLLYLNYLPEDRFTLSEQGQPPDYVIWSMRERDENRAPTYVSVHEEKIDGYPPCIVQMHSDAATR